MAKRAKRTSPAPPERRRPMAKRTGLNILNSIAEEDPEGGITVKLPESVRGNLRVMRWLHHRVVDVMADHGLVECLVHDVEARLGTLSFEIVGDYVTDLIREAGADGKAVSRG